MQKIIQNNNIKKLIKPLIITNAAGNIISVIKFFWVFKIDYEFYKYLNKLSSNNSTSYYIIVLN